MLHLDPQLWPLLIFLLSPSISSVYTIGYYMTHLLNGSLEKIVCILFYIFFYTAVIIQFPIRKYES